MEKKIILHLGLGKTATTLLQNKFFPILHQQNLLHYYNINTDVYKNFANIIRQKDSIFDRYDLEIKKSINKIDKEVVLISDETLIPPYSHTNLSIADFFKRINYIFDQPIIIISIRNQVDALVSHYLKHSVSRGLKLKKKYYFVSFNEYYNNLVSNNFHINFSLRLKYKKLLKSFLISGDKSNFKIIIYEKIFYDKNEYIDDWFKSLDLSAQNKSIYLDMFKYKINTSISENLFFYYKLRSNFFLYYFERLLRKLFNILNINYINLIQNITKGKTKKIVIPENQKIYIQNIYFEDNKYIEEQFNLDLKKYKYFN